VLSEDGLQQRRHQRVLRSESAAASVIRHWLTGEVYEDPPREEQRRQPYRKMSATRKQQRLVA